MKKQYLLYKKILSKQPDAIAAMYNLSRSYNSLGKFEKSKKLFFQMLKLQIKFYRSR